jgi:hypothetical protein
MAQGVNAAAVSSAFRPFRIRMYESGPNRVLFSRFLPLG